uniref:Uncharacterized protein n=1 Tax=viral metagenome TaxID=1070528 RepID=A0A6C0LG16_9ZZZZ
MTSIDDEWTNFISTKSNASDDENDFYESNEVILDEELLETPKSGQIYISTKSKIAYLDKEIDLKNVFWKIPVIPYSTPQNGVIKKQMKFNSTTTEEVAYIQECLQHELYVDQQIMTSINNPNGRIKFKDIRKISIGVSKKDIMSYRCKRKSAFYNCFVMILRIRIKGIFKEFHIKVFNTGKLEIPGIQTDEIFHEVLQTIKLTLQPFVSEPLDYNQKSDTVLINSNFNCGFFINREVLYDILKYKYNIQCIYDPCSYPGIQCKFYYNPELKVQTGSQISEEKEKDKDKKKKEKKEKKNKNGIVEVSFMIFRTGSILIVGMCEEYVLYYIYEFLKTLLTNEFQQIHQKLTSSVDSLLVKDKKKKVRRKNITITSIEV